ncbi:hypothetical protein SAMN02799624_04753 [Paenibacillus sp. UNC496MF]|uniref:CocE/NonD family hydrolase n=1 Tax=Paenibacillus sp. UNC496MF TaxID=1502753 RepID=UPI0008EA5628|nr:CocE/NonD family hydrolase [Paenibacillus sp. UNC496MF]SFJ49784.1 hypothetical protein SAMN02799624_04753 [Paenibacillus sp. UNC496MF]
MRFGDVTVKRNVPCTLRDGVILYADIYLPEETGEYPVLLLRQPYGRKIASTVSHAHPVWYASQGYMVIVQDVRGRGDSEGEFVPFVHEAEDGFDAVEWAAKLPYANGKVGMYGFSYQGIAQWAAASLRPPALKTIVPSMTAGDVHRWAYPHGSFSNGMLIWAFQLARDSARRAGDLEAERACSAIMSSPDAMLRHLPLNDRHPILERYCPAYFDWVNRPEYDAYWLSLNWLPAFLDHPIPTFHIGGWYDFLLDGTVQSYLALQETAPARTPDLFHRLEIGPWVHIPWGRKAGGVDHGPEADGDMHRKQARWFDYWLKGERDNGLYEEPAVRYFDLQARGWKTAEAYPEHAGGRKWLLSGSAKPANGALGGGRLTETAPDDGAAPDVFVYDARLPMPLAGYAPADRSGIQDRTEMLVYTGEPLAEAVGVLGAPVVNACVQSMEGPTDLVAILSMLEPDGTARFLSVGRAEIGRNDGGWCRARIVMRPIAATFRPGSAIRLELTGSAFPTLIRHPNGIPLNDARRAEESDLTIAVVAVKSRAGMESWIELPVTED